MNEILIKHYNLKGRVIVNLKRNKEIGEAFSYLWKKAKWVQPNGAEIIFHDERCQCRKCSERACKEGGQSV